MRWLFLTVTILLFELFTYGIGRGLQWWAGAWLNDKSIRYMMISLFIFSNALLMFGISRITSIGLKVSMTWLTVMWFIIMSMIAVGLINLLLAKIAPAFFASNWYQSFGVRFLLPLWLLGLIVMGLYNAYMPTIRHISLTVNQPMSKPLRIAVASDLHLGWLVGNREIKRLTEIVKAQKVDVVLMPGDILDDNTSYYESNKMQPQMNALANAAPMGVYASLGNHDLYGSEAEIRKALIKAGVKLVVDETVLVNDQFWLIGRLDDHDQSRKPTEKLLPPTINKPVILLDHRPTQIETNTQLPIDLQLSGHTHNGQVFPANFIVKAINRLAYGHERINHTDVIVSSGYGFWGVPFRLGSQSEVWIIDVTGKN